MPRDGRPTRERILAAAERLVIDNGFAATSVDQVIAAAASSKGAFFHHFESKRALADALVERYVAADLDMLEEGLTAAREAGEDPVTQAVAFLQHYEDAADEIMRGTTGCLYASILAERQLVSAGTSEPIARAVLAWREGYAALLRAALGEHRDVDADALADHVFVTFEGAYLLARTTGDPRQLRSQLALLRSLVATLLTGSVSPGDPVSSGDSRGR